MSIMLERVRNILEMIRFSHTLFALPFALVSALLAWQQPGSFRALDLAGILLCMVFARSAAMAFNRLADRRLDAANPRTAKRHLPAGKLTIASVWVFTAVCTLCFVASTAIFTVSGNFWPLRLSVPVLLFIFGYSYSKRFTILCHFWLGASLLLAPLATWIAIRGMADLLAPMLLGGAVLAWVAGFDILYSCQDVDFDRRTRLASVPARLGIQVGLRIALACHAVMIALLLALYWTDRPHLGAIYLAGVVAAAILLACEHWLVRPDDLTRVNVAFFHVNGIISVGLFLVVLLQLLSDRFLEP
jgi:4-hydroxybenzoate polyprenyltransferase